MVGSWWTTRQNALLECFCFRREPESLLSNPDILGYTSQLEGAPLAYPGMLAGALLWEMALSRRCKHYELPSEEYLRVPHIIPFAGIMHKGKVVSVSIIVNIREQ